jgi:hypothetical protein
MSVIVTSFMSNINNSKSIDLYMNYGTLMLSNCQTAILFIERYVYDLYFPKINEPTEYFTHKTKIYEYFTKNNVTYVFFEKKDNYLYDHINNITNFHEYISPDGKDTLEYMFTMCHKTEWLMIANTFFNYKKPLIWIDLGIYHIFNNNYKLFCDSMKSIQSDVNYNNKIIIGSIIDPVTKMLINQESLYKKPIWFFAGGVVGGMPDELALFARLMENECISLIDTKKHLTWEVNMWYLVYLKNPDLFKLYECDHNYTIIANYR